MCGHGVQTAQMCFIAILKTAMDRLFRKPKVRMFMAMKHNKAADIASLSTLTLTVPEEKIRPFKSHAAAHSHYGDRYYFC